MDFVDLLTSDATAVQWVVARVRALNYIPDVSDRSRRTVDLVIGDLNAAPETTVAIRNAAVIQTYAPRVGDVVHALVHPNVGTLVLGMSATEVSAFPAFVKLGISTPVSIPNNASTAITSWQKVTDLSSWVPGTGAAGVSIPKAGVYHIRSHVAWTANSVGARRVTLLANGKQIGVETESTTPGFTSDVSVAVAEYLTADTFISASVYQNSGGVLSIASATLTVTELR